MKLERVDPTDARAVLRGLRGAVLGAGPAIALGGARDAATAALPPDVPPGTGVIVTTSGSTGFPKSVVLSRAALTASALATADRLGSGAWLLALPPGYIAGVQVLVRALVSGREPAILSGSFSAHAFVAAASSMASARGGQRMPTYTSLVPAQLQTLLDAPGTDARRALAGFEAVLIGGQALAPALAARAADAGVRVVRTYGSSETAGGCVYDGIPLAGVEVRVVDGEVQLSGPTLAEGYLGEPDRTGSAFVWDAAGTRWYRTGDTGTFDGQLSVTGRLDNVIISGGINVSLDRVERIVRALPGLHDAVVVAVPDPRWGQASVVVVPRRADAEDAGQEPDGDAELSRVRDAVTEQLGAHARPRAVITVAGFPLLPSGKPDRVELARIASGAHPGR